MGLIAAVRGTLAAVINTEHQVAQQTGLLGIYVLTVDTSSMQAGDTLIVRVKTMVLPAGTTRLAYAFTYSDVQTEPIKFTLPVPVDQEIICSLQQTTGTGRSFPWSLLRA